MGNKSRHWKKLKSRLVYQNPWIKVKEDTVILPDGGKGIYGYIEKDTGAFIIALDKDNSIYMVRQYRYPIKKTILDLPGGVTGDENILKHAKKELNEETGIKAKTWEKLGSFYVGPGHETTFIYVYLATDLDTSKLAVAFQEGDETILEVVKIRVPDLKEMIRNNQIECGISIAALNLFFLK